MSTLANFSGAEFEPANPGLYLVPVPESGDSSNGVLVSDSETLDLYPDLTLVSDTSSKSNETTGGVVIDFTHYRYQRLDLLENEQNQSSLRWLALSNTIKLELLHREQYGKAMAEARALEASSREEILLNRILELTKKAFK